MRERDEDAGGRGSTPTRTGAWPQRRADFERPVQQSLLDRLIDRDPRGPVLRGGGSGVYERPMTREESVLALKAALRRDLEWLLNTRRELVDVPEALVETRRSLVRYGIPDTSSMSRDAGTTGRRLARAVEEALTLFEPRLTQVRVTAVQGAGGRTELRFVIDALLRLDPVPERVTFDTVLELASGQYRVDQTDQTG